MTLEFFGKKIFGEYIWFYRDVVLNYSLFEFYEFWYLPSFFLFYPLFINYFIYSTAIIGSILVSIYLMFKYYGWGFWTYIFLVLLTLKSLGGNAGILISPFVIYILNNKDKTRSILLLALISFVLTTFILVLYLFIKAENKKRFLSIFIPSLFLWNFHFLINPHHFILYLETGIDFFIFNPKDGNILNLFTLLARPFSMILIFHIIYNKSNLKYKYNIYLKPR